jgi:hypothetical protein
VLGLSDEWEREMSDFWQGVIVGSGVTSWVVITATIVSRYLGKPRDLSR